MKKIILTSAVALLLAPLTSFACGEGIINVEKPVVSEKVIELIKDKAKIKKIERIDVSEELPGYFEVFDGNSLLYIRSDAKYVLSGNLFNTETGENITMRSMFKKRVVWKDLPFDLAFEGGDLKSKNKIAVFTDPDCPICKEFESSLSQIKDLHVYFFLNPLTGLHPQSRDKSKVILCSDDQFKVYEDFTLNGRQLVGGEDLASCEEKMTKLDKLMDKLNFHSTPTIVNPDGLTFKGAVPVQNILGFAKLKVKQKPKK